MSRTPRIAMVRDFAARQRARRRFARAFRALRRRAASCLRGTRGTRRRPVEMYPIRSATPNLAIAATVSPPPAIENAGDARDRLGDRARAVPRTRRTRTRRPDRSRRSFRRSRSSRSKLATVCGPMSRIRSSSATSSIVLIAGAASAANAFAHTTSTGTGTLPGNSLEDRPRLVDQIRLGERLADAPAGREHERVGDAAADDQRVDLCGERAQDRQLRRHLRAGDDRNQRPLRILRARGRAHRAPRRAAGRRRRSVRSAPCACVVASARCAVPNASLQ